MDGVTKRSPDEDMSHELLEKKQLDNDGTKDNGTHVVVEKRNKLIYGINDRPPFYIVFFWNSGTFFYFLFLNQFFNVFLSPSIWSKSIFWKRSQLLIKTSMSNTDYLLWSLFHKTNHKMIRMIQIHVHYHELVSGKNEEK